MSATLPRSNCFSGVTITSSMSSSLIYPLRARLHLFGLFESFLDRADHIKCLFRDVVVLSFHDFLEAAHGVLDLDVLAFEAGELCSHEHRLRKELFDLACARHGALVFIGKFFDAENGDD